MGLSIKGRDRHCLSLVMLYSLLSKSFMYNVYFLTPFDTCDCFYFESNLSLVFFIEVLLIKKAFNVVL